MAWTATVVQYDKPNNIVHLHFSESVSGAVLDNQYPVPLGAPATFIGDLAASVIAQLTAQQAAAGAIPTPGQPITPTAPVIDPNAALKAAFLTQFTQLQQMQRAIAVSLKTTADADYVTLLGNVKTAFAANQAILLPLV